MIETEDIRLSQERLAALKELITPIKDLAKNWDVDLNSELEKYMSTFEQDINPDNFAEAALVIQGSAGVWSKKVEFLYSLAVNSVEMLEKTEEKKREKRHDDEGEVDEGEEMMTLAPVVIKQAAEVYVDLSSLPRTVNFKPRIPLFLTHASVKNDKPENLLYNKKGELLASRDDFALNNCIINKFGFASLDIQTCLLLNQTIKKTAITPFFKRNVSQYVGFVEEKNANPQLQPINLASAVDENLSLPPETESLAPDPLEMSVPEPAGALDICDDDSDDDIPAAAESTAIDSKLTAEPLEPKTPQPSSSKQLGSRLGMKTDSIVTEWPAEGKMMERLDPYEQLPAKPFKKAAIEKPRSGQKRKKHNPPKSSLLEFLQSSNKIKNNKEKFPNILRKPVFPENVDLFKNLKSKDALANRNIMKKLVVSVRKQPIPKDFLKAPVVHESPDSEDDPEPEGFNDDAADDFCGTITEPPNQLDECEDIIKNMEASHLEALETSQREALIPPNLGEPSYEEMVKEHVMKYTTEARNHFHVSELRSRVLEWENKINPILEEEEKSDVFDVCVYSNKLLDKLASCPNETSHFRNLVSGEKKGEISRLFLTSLMLTNSGNIQISGETNDNTQCKMISRKLFSDVLKTYIAPEADSEDVPSSSKKRKNLPP